MIKGLKEELFQDDAPQRCHASAGLLFRHGLRFGHYIGQQKIRLQALWTALVANLKRLAKLVKKDGKTLEEALIRVKA